MNKDILDIFDGLAYSENPIEAIDSYLSIVQKLPKGLCIRQFSIFHKSDLSNILLQKTEKIYSIFAHSPSPNFIKLTYKNPNSGITDNGAIAILPSKSPNISRITTIAKSSFWNNTIRRLVRNFYPEAMSIFFRQNEIQESLLQFESKLGPKFRIRIADVTAKEERSINTGAKYKKLDTQRWWTDQPIEEVFSQAQERDVWFSGLRFIIQQKINNTSRYTNVSSGRLYKFGELSYDDFYSTISSTLLNNLETQASKRLSTLDGRGLRERNYQPASPIEIAYDYEIFSEIEEIRRFGNVVNTYPHSTKTLYHVNPYYHSSVADYLDGSSFEVWVLSPSKILLIPQAKSSAQAFERFIGHISSNFYEGAINEYQE